VPILVLSILSVTIAFISLCISLTNYNNQRDTNRPFMAAANNQRTNGLLLMYWTNVGLQTGTRGLASLYYLPDDGKPQKISEAAVAGAGMSLLVRAGVSTTFTISGQNLKRDALYLVCMDYFDQAGASYNQPFLFRLIIDDRDAGDPMKEVPLAEAKQATTCQSK
jgi:hypothetical protein